MRALSRGLGAFVSVLLLSAALPLTGASAATATPFGPDVSRWQHALGAPIDWGRVKAAGSSFAIIKATEGAGYTNPWFGTDRRAATGAHLLAGGYAFARPARPLSTATDQARLFAAVLGDQRTTGTLPPVLDLESSGGLSPAELITWSQQFLETLRSLTGRTPVVYSYPYFWSTAMAGTAALTRYPLWLAAYRSTAPSPVGSWPTWSLWQYSSTSTLPGIQGAVDMSRFAGTPAGLAAFADGTAPSTWTVTAPRAPMVVTARAGIRSATVRWRPADDGGRLPSSFTVTASPGGAQVSVGGASSAATVLGLTVGKAYTFTVRATNPAGTSLTSAPSVAVVPGQLPTTPGRPTATPAASAVSLTWPASAGSPTGYLVHRCSTSGCTPTGTVAAVTGRGYVDRGLVNGTRYTYSVSARNGFGTSAVSATAGAVPVAPPSAPVLVRPVLTAVLSSVVTTSGHSVVLSGQTSAAFAGQRVYRQGYYSGAWHTWASTLVDTSGRYRWVVTPTVVTVNHYRVWIGATALHLAAVSRTVDLTVR